MQRADHLVFTVWLILLFSLASLTSVALAGEPLAGPDAHLDQTLGALSPVEDLSRDRHAPRQPHVAQRPSGQAGARAELVLQYQMHSGNNRHGPSPQAMLSARRPVAPQAHALASKRVVHPWRFSVKVGVSGGNGRQ